MSRKKSREYAFKLVFEKFFHEPEMDLDIDSEDIDINVIDKDFVNLLTNGVNDNYDQIFDVLKENVVGYQLERLYKIDLAILVLAVYELKFSVENLSSNTIINEAVELAKKYSTDKSYNFINGVLAKIVKND